MISKECKRLAEVDFPIARVSLFARAEKDSRIAHIPRLHVWPAARPGGACRAVPCSCLPVARSMRPTLHQGVLQQGEINSEPVPVGQAEA
ncbi:MAG: DUF1156 domain-containing protein [Pirellulales bacterium]|nr:DUF1156 domain-containing protein [Pirellulales bacterium]